MEVLLTLSLLAIVALFADILRYRTVLLPIILMGLAAAAFFAVKAWPDTRDGGTIIYGMMKLDRYAIGFTLALILGVGMWFLMAHESYKSRPSLTDHYALVLFALVGGLVMVSFTNIVMLFLGIEILSIPMYILAGSNKDQLSSNEASFKYLIMGAFATGFLLFGVALVYGATGSFDLMRIQAAAMPSPVNTLPAFFYVGLMLILVGMLFKISAVPFHFWAPDVYEGAPTPVTAYMSTIVKTAAIGAFLRLFKNCFVDASSHWTGVLAAVIVLTLVVSNITAVYQNNVKRMLAYSSISHAGYLLMAVLVLNGASSGAAIYYSVAYILATIPAFTVIYIVSKRKGTESFDAFNGLVKTNPFLAGILTLSMLSMAGIPPFAGFFAKYYMFVSAIFGGYMWLIIIAILCSLIGVYYYFRLIIAMFFKEPESAQRETDFLVHPVQKIMLVVAAILLLAAGLMPDWIISRF